jgi:hypothetical protein
MVTRLSVMITESINRPDPNYYSAQVSGTSHVARNHRDARLRQIRAKFICLDNHRRAPLRRSQI